MEAIGLSTRRSQVKESSRALLAEGTVKNLNAKAWMALIVLAVAMGLMLFVPAGTVHYWQAWIYLSIFVGASALITVYLMRRDPALLERRMSGGPMAEKRRAQKFIMFWTSICFIALLVVPAFDHRFGWSTVPVGGVVSGDVLIALGFYFIFLVYRENTFTSATIEVAENQKVISTGPYAIVRHPMYASASLYLLGTPLALGSYWALIAIAAMIPFLIWRLLDEERFLAKNLSGYDEYQKRVRYRLVPYLW
jgi:protein-S-isoprenylcysteine O-methyltransferase Ste14